MSDDGKPRLRDRRASIVAAVGIGTSLLTAGAIALLVSRTAVPTGPSVPAAGPDVAALFGDATTAALPDGWRIERIYGVYCGAIPVVVTDRRGEQVQIDVLRRAQGGPAGVADTASLSLYLANRGDGSALTSARLGSVAEALAGVLSAHERAGLPLPDLLTFEQRQKRYPDGEFSVTPKGGSR